MYDIQQEVVYLGLKQPFWDKFPGCYFHELLLGNLPKWASIGSTDTRQIGVFFLHLMSTDHGAQSLTISWRTFRQLGGEKMSPWHQFHQSEPNWVDMSGKTGQNKNVSKNNAQNWTGRWSQFSSISVLVLWQTRTKVFTQNDEYSSSMKNSKWSRCNAYTNNLGGAWRQSLIDISRTRN